MPISKNIPLKENSKITLRKILNQDQKLELNNIYIIDLPRTESTIKVRIVLNERAKFDGNFLLKINKGASQANVYLSVKCLLLSSQARAHVVPSLEIRESDVKASHEATIGYLEENELNYLMSRGILREEAESFLIEAFLKS